MAWGQESQDTTQANGATTQANGAQNGSNTKNLMNGHATKKMRTPPIEELAALRKQMREEYNRSRSGKTSLPQEQDAFRKQQEALKFSVSQGQKGMAIPRGVLPEHGAKRLQSSPEADASTKADSVTPSNESQTQFMSKDDLQRMRHEMREQCRQRQRDQARRRADMEAETPLFLSLRMRRMLEFVLAKPPSDLESGNNGALDHCCLADNISRVVATLTFGNKFPPSYVRHFLQSEQQSKQLRLENGDGEQSAKMIYEQLLNRMRNELREDPPTGADFNSMEEPLQPAKIQMLDKRNSPKKRGQYGVAALNNEDVVNMRRQDDRGPPKTWFGQDDATADDGYVYKKIIKTNLPIAQHKADICKFVREQQVTLVQGETGCGKTTQVPQYILEMAVSMQKDQRRAVRIIVTQPRRIAAITVAKRVAEELGEKVGEGVVGYKIRGTTLAGPNCKIMFCTTGVVLRRLANEGQKWMFSPKTVTHLLVDEVHERGVETDFMLTFLKEVQAKRPNLRVVLMSATMDTECFLKYFCMGAPLVKCDSNGEAGPTVEEYKPALIICPAFCYPVQELYIENINARLGRNKPADAKSPDELRRGNNDYGESDGIDYELIMNILEEVESSPDGPWTFAAAAGNIAENKPSDPSKGAVLIFFPGLGEISQMMSTISESSKYADKWWVVPLHASLPPEEQQECFQTDLPAGKIRKIICSTNVAETSVTVPDVTMVIDSCRERRNQVDRYSNTPMLREQWCAKDSLKQRRGRAGRVQPGVCFRLIPERYIDRLEEITPPEMQRVPLENVYLQVCASGISDRIGFLAKTPDPPDETAILFAEAVLSDLGALDFSVDDGLTALGRHLASLPCHPRLGKILVLGCLLGVPGATLSICAAMSARNPLLTTQDQQKRQRWQEERHAMVDSIKCRSDHCVWAHILQQWRFGDIKQRDLCRQLGISFERMCSAIFERKHLCEALVSTGLLPDSFLRNEWYDSAGMPDWTLVRAAVVGGLYPNIIHVERSVPRYQSSSPSEKAKWMRYSVLQRHHSRQDSMSYPKSLNLHPNSMCFGQDQYHYPWLAFYTIQHTTKLYAYDVSEVNPWALLLFGAPPTYNSHTQQLEVGGWARFVCPNGDRILPLVMAARAGLEKVMARKADEVKYDPSDSKELAACIQLLKTNGLGYRDMSPEIVRKERRQRDEDEFDEFQNETAYMLQKDKEKEDMMKEAFEKAKRQARGEL